MPAALPPRPDWLVLGATVLAAGVELRVCGIRPSEEGWEIMATNTAQQWVPAGDLTFLRPPVAGYHPWPGSSIDLGMGR